MFDALQLFSAEVYFHNVRLVFAKYIPNCPLLVFQSRFPGVQLSSQLSPSNPCCRIHLCFPFPPAHKSLSYITVWQGDKLCCTATCKHTHMDQTIRRGIHRGRKGSGRQMMIFFILPGMRSCQLSVELHIYSNTVCTNIRLLVSWYWNIFSSSLSMFQANSEYIYD